jgi:arylsulfatase A
MNKTILTLLATFMPLAGGCKMNTFSGENETTPNILLIVVDDLGYSDLHCYGGGIQETPHVDQLAEEGVRFINAYASSTVCSPTRASLLTGKNPVAVNITDYIPGHQEGKIQPWHKFIVPEFHFHLPHEEITIAEKLKEKGYATASIGKWHLGGKGYLPTDQGFDINIAGNHKGLPPTYYYPYKVSDEIRQQNPWRDFEITPLEIGKDSLYLTDRLTNEAIQYIKERKDSTFFLYLPFYTVHTPIQGRPDLVAKYEEKLKTHSDSIERNAHFLAMVECMDENVGRIVQTLEDLEIRDNTLIIFVSDNGGFQIRGKKEKGDYHRILASWNYPLREGKGTLYEGGLRVPTIINWPGRIEGGKISDEIIISTDVFPTIMELTGMNYDQEIEGVSLWPHLIKNASIDRETLYWHYPHYHKTNPGAVIRDGDYKLIRYFENERTELYNLVNDLGETKDLSNQMPQKTAQLLNKLNQWLEEEGAKMPTPNPDYEKN